MERTTCTAYLSLFMRGERKPSGPISVYQADMQTDVYYTDLFRDCPQASLAIEKIKHIWMTEVAPDFDREWTRRAYGCGYFTQRDDTASSSASTDAPRECELVFVYFPLYSSTVTAGTPNSQRTAPFATPGQTPRSAWGNGVPPQHNSQAPPPPSWSGQVPPSPQTPRGAKTKYTPFSPSGQSVPASANSNASASGAPHQRASAPFGFRAPPTELSDDIYDYLTDLSLATDRNIAKLLWIMEDVDPEEWLEKVKRALKVSEATATALTNLMRELCE